MLRLNETKNNFSAIEMIRLKVAWQTENPSHTKGIDYTPGKAITVTTRVEPEGENVHFTVTVDGKPYIKWGGPKDVLYTYSGWNALPGNRLGIAISSESLTVHSARFKLLSGSAHLPE